MIKGNLFSHSSPGVLIGGDGPGNRNEVRGNRFVRNSEGILVAPGSRNVLTRNHLSRDGSGIGIEKGRHNLVARNVVLDARAGASFSESTSPTGPSAASTTSSAETWSNGAAAMGSSSTGRAPAS